MLPKHCLLVWIGVILSSVSSLAVATSQRTFVASTGADNPNCSIAAPCRAFAAAITATSSGGEIIVLESAGYGRVTITKSVSIIASPGIYAGISVLAGFDGVTVNAPGATVVLRGLSINGQGGANGILFQQGSRMRIENCVISGMAAVGIYHQANNAEMIVLDTIVRDNQDGIGLVAADASITLDHVRSEHNLGAGFYIAPTPGSAGANAMITDGLFAHNGGNGIWADTVGGATTTVDVERVVASENGNHGFTTTAGAAGAQSDVMLRHNVFNRNSGYGVYVLTTFGGNSATITDNSTVGNLGVVAGIPYGMFIDGGNGNASVSRNTGQRIGCSNGANPVTYQDNSAPVLSSVGCSFKNLTTD
jgi:hypothetical protein